MQYETGEMAYKVQGIIVFNEDVLTPNINFLANSKYFEYFLYNLFSQWNKELFLGLIL